MSGPVRWGVILGAAVAAMSLIFGLTGWYRQLSMATVYLVVAILLNVVAVVMALREQAATATWTEQIKNGLIVGVVASVLIFVGSWLVTSVIVPDYFAQMAEGYREAYAATGLSEAEVEELVAGTAAMSPVRSALDGVIGTLGTSLITAAVAGWWLRAKG